MVNGKLAVALADPKKRASLERRMDKKVMKLGPDDCWPWTGAVNQKGYGCINAGRSLSFKAHRVAYALANGPIGDTIHVCHSCDSPPCCNPGHHFLGTPADNMRDCVRKGRASPPPVHAGETHHNARFDAETARRIAADTRPARIVAGDYGISDKTVYRLRWGQTWKGLVPVNREAPPP